MSTRRSVSNTLAGEPLDGLRIGDVNHVGHGVAARGLDLGRHCGCAVAVDIDDVDAGALAREQARRRPPDPGAGARDNCDLAAQVDVAHDIPSGRAQAAERSAGRQRGLALKCSAGSATGPSRSRSRSAA